jgi:hypothetical protein
MNRTPNPGNQITTTSVEDGLDFACSLITDAIVQSSKIRPETAFSRLSELSDYIRLRYVGESGLALEYLAGLGHECRLDQARRIQFWSQIRWIAEAMQLGPDELSRLEVPIV